MNMIFTILKGTSSMSTDCIMVLCILYNIIVILNYLNVYVPAGIRLQIKIHVSSRLDYVRRRILKETILPQTIFTC